jgi:LPXTG-motif cell wall-anchored protein
MQRSFFALMNLVNLTMRINEILLGIAGVLLMAVVLFMLFRNRKEEEEFEQELNE